MLLGTEENLDPKYRWCNCARCGKSCVGDSDRNTARADGYKGLVVQERIKGRPYCSDCYQYVNEPTQKRR